MLIAVGDDHTVAMFDCQTMWNDGLGSDIGEDDNRVILREFLNVLTERLIGVVSDVLSIDPSLPGNGDAVVAPVLPLLHDE